MVKEKTGDLFMDLATQMGCTYISDLRGKKNCNAARRILNKAYFTGYSVEQWRDLLNYLSVEGDKQIESESQAKILLGGID